MSDEETIDEEIIDEESVGDFAKDKAIRLRDRLLHMFGNRAAAGRIDQRTIADTIWRKWKEWSGRNNYIPLTTKTVLPFLKVTYGIDIDIQNLTDIADNNDAIVDPDGNTPNPGPNNDNPPPSNPNNDNSPAPNDAQAATMPANNGGNVADADARQAERQNQSLEQTRREQNQKKAAQRRNQPVSGQTQQSQQSQQANTGTNESYLYEDGEEGTHDKNDILLDPRRFFTGLANALMNQGKAYTTRRRRLIDRDPPSADDDYDYGHRDAAMSGRNGNNRRPNYNSNIAPGGHSFDISNMSSILDKERVSSTTMAKFIDRATKSNNADQFASKVNFDDPEVQEIAKKIMFSTLRSIKDEKFKH